MFFLLDASLYSKEFVVAVRLLALEHNAAGQPGALNSTNEALPCVDSILVLLDVHLVHDLLVNNMLEMVLRKCS